MSSGPVALLGFRFFSSFLTLFGCTFISGASGKLLVPRSGKVLVSSMVKADKNCPFRISDLVLASLWVYNIPSFFSGATPELSHFVSLTKEECFLQLDSSLTISQT